MQRRKLEWRRESERERESEKERESICFCLYSFICYIPNSRSHTQGYCYVHRLLLAFVFKYPKLKQMMEKATSSFAKREGSPHTDSLSHTQTHTQTKTHTRWQTRLLTHTLSLSLTPLSRRQACEKASEKSWKVPHLSQRDFHPMEGRVPSVRPGEPGSKRPMECVKIICFFLIFFSE